MCSGSSEPWPAHATPVEYRPSIFLGALGLRWSEAAGLKVDNIDFLRNKPTVTQTVAEVNGRIHDADVKTDASRRTVSSPGFLTSPFWRTKRGPRRSRSVLCIGRDAG
jgi:integrase